MSGTMYDDPNREAVGLPPIWGPADPPPPEGRTTKAAKGKHGSSEGTTDEAS